MTTTPSEDVWQALDWNAGRMSRRTFATLIAGALIVGVLGLAGLIGWRSGILWPNISRDPSHAGWEIHTDTQSFELSFPVRNDGLVPVDISSLGRSGHGLTLLTAQIAQSHLAAGNSTEITLVYKVDDCDAVEAGPWPVPLHVSRGRTAYVSAPDINAPVDPGNLPWQVKLAGMACGRIAVSA